MTASLYERLLGDDFASLSPPLASFHRQTAATAAGEFIVMRPSGPFIGLVARLMGLPAQGDNVPLRLVVQRDGHCETWRRWFGPTAMFTRQWQWRKLLIEAAGLMSFGIELRVRHGGMTFRSRRCWLLGLPLARLLAPRVTAVVLPQPEGWQVRVRIRLPLVGEVTRYQGQVTPDVCDAQSFDGARRAGSV